MNKPRKAKSKLRRLQPLPLDASETKCGICLDEVLKRGKIGPCSHLYCFTCLLEWSKLNNTCPQCKLTFRCISRIDFKTDKFEDKVFIKDKTLRTGHVSSDEEYYVNSSEIEDSDPDFIDYGDVTSTIDPPSEPEAEFTQRKRRCDKTPHHEISSRDKTPPKKRRTKRRSKAVIYSDSESDGCDGNGSDGNGSNGNGSDGNGSDGNGSDGNGSDGNGAVHQKIISCGQSPDLFESPQSKTTLRNSAILEAGPSVADNFRSPRSSRYNCKFNSTTGSKQELRSPKECSSSKLKQTRFSSPNAKQTCFSSPKAKRTCLISPDSSWRGPQSPKTYLTSPKLSKSARWASLDHKVKSLKRKRSSKKVLSKRSTVAIKTLSPGNSTNKWLSTASRDMRDKENVTPNKSSVNSQFKIPFKKTHSPFKKTCSPPKTTGSPPKTTGSPEKLFEDPEQYFASIINSDS